jgi:hypothetical protein
VWAQQKRWELKRDAWFDTTKRIAVLRSALLALSSAYKVLNVEANPNKRAAFLGKTIEVNEAWFEAARNFDPATLLVALVCGREVNNLLLTFGEFTRRLAKGMSEHPEAFSTSVKDLQVLSDAIAAATRKEIGVEPA